MKSLRYGSNDLTEFEKPSFSKSPSEQGQPSAAEAYGYPQRAIELLFEGYSAPSTSHTRLKSVTLAKQLFQSYVNILQLGIQPSKITYELPAPTVEELGTLFPFQKHLLREGEPSMENLTDLSSLQFELENDYPMSEYGEWAKNQPDKRLLLNDRIQRLEWLEAGGRVEPSKIFAWWRHRSVLVAWLQKAGSEAVLDTYWPNNKELRVLPPFDWQVQRIVPKSS